MDREILLKRVVLTCRDFVRQLAYHRAMQPYITNLKTNIWIYTFNNFIDMAVLDWCHLFGNRKDDLHWRNIVSDTDRFKQNILDTLGTTEAEWKMYWQSVKGYRDKDVAHIEVRPETTAPEMDKALKTINLYYTYAISELHDAGAYMELPDGMSHFVHEVRHLADNYVQNRVVNLFEYTGQS